MESFTYFGVTVSSDLRLHEHVAAVSVKATHVLNILCININVCSSEVEALAFSSLVRPHLEYASASWDPYMARDTQQLEGVQCHSAQFLHKDYRSTTSLSQLLSYLNWSPLSSRRKISRLVIFYKGLHGICPILLDHPRRPTRHTRSIDGLIFIHLPAHVDCYKCSFFPRTVIDWNTLPSAIQCLSFVSSFRNSMHRMVFTGHPSY